MRLTNERRIEIILMAGSGSSRMVARNSNRKYGTSITHNAVAKLICKFKKTGNNTDQQRSGPRCTPLMKTHQLCYLLELYVVQAKVQDGCPESVVSADRLSGTF